MAALVFVESDDTPPVVSTSTMVPVSGSAALALATSAVSVAGAAVSVARYERMRSQTAPLRAMPRRMKKTERNESFFS